MYFSFSTQSERRHFLYFIIMEMQVSCYVWAILMGGREKRSGCTEVTEAEQAGPSLKFALTVGS